MSKILTQQQFERLPEDGDYRDWVLYMASENGGVFNRDDYHNTIAKRAKGQLARLDTAIKELEDSRVLIKRAHGRIYDLTNDGLARFNRGEFTKGGTSKIYTTSSFDSESTSKQNQEESSEQEITEEPNNVDKDQSQSEKIDDYTVRKLNRTADGIDQVERNVNKSSFWIMWASIVSALAIVSQVFIAVKGTTKIDGEVRVVPKQEKLDSLEEALTETIAAKGRQTLKLDSLEKELQKLTTKSDSASPEPVNDSRNGGK